MLPPPYFAFAAMTVHLYNTLDVFSQRMELIWYGNCFCSIQFNNQVVLLKEIFSNWPRRMCQKFWPSKIQKQLLIYLILVSQASNFYQGFYNALSISSPRIKLLFSCKYF